MDEHAISFGPYRLLAARRLLLEGDKPVRLGSRAFDILAALVERAGEVVGKDELRTRAWPETFVEESNLKIQVSALRRVLGDGQSGQRFIVTVPGRGYNFVAPVSLGESPPAPLPPAIAPAGAHNLPLAVTRMIGIPGRLGASPAARRCRLSFDCRAAGRQAVVRHPYSTPASSRRRAGRRPRRSRP